MGTNIFYYFFDMLLPVVSGVLFLAYFACFNFLKEKPCLWMGLFFLLHTLIRLMDNIFGYIPTDSNVYELYSSIWWLITRAVLTYLYYKIIATKSDIEVPGREKAMLVAFGVIVFIMALIPETNSIYHTFLCYIMFWGVIRLFPVRKDSSVKKMLFFTVCALLCLQFLDLILALVFKIDKSELLMRLFSAVYVLAAIADIIYILKNRKTEKEEATDPILLLAAKYDLTAREEEIVRLLISGYTAKEIGSMLFISEGTAKVHIHNIYQKLQISRRAQIGVRIEEITKSS